MSGERRLSAIAAGNAIWSKEIEGEGTEESLTDEEDEIDYLRDEEESSEVNSENDEDDEESNDEDENIENLCAKDGEIWNLKPNPTIGRAGTHNIITGQYGPTAECKRKLTSIIDAFQLFMTDAMIEMIVKYTNEEGLLTMGERWKQTSKEEIRQYIGLLYLAGVFRSANEPLHNL